MEEVVHTNRFLRIIIHTLGIGEGGKPFMHLLVEQKAGEYRQIVGSPQWLEKYRSTIVRAAFVLYITGACPPSRADDCLRSLPHAHRKPPSLLETLRETCQVVLLKFTWLSRNASARTVGEVGRCAANC